MWGVAPARKIPKKRFESSTKLAAAGKRATVVPREIAEDAWNAGCMTQSCVTEVRPSVRADLTVAMILAIAAAEAGLYT